MKHWPAKALTLLLRGYQYFISPWLGSNCRFTPTCSQYAIEAIAFHGVVKGLWLTMSRVGRCHPWHPGGYDPVPTTHADQNDKPDS